MEKGSVLIVMVAALVIPIAMARLNVSNIPTVVAEIITGIILGKSAFNIVQANEMLTLMSTLGVIMLMFLSGMEIDFDLFKKGPDKNQDGQNPVQLAGQAFGLIIIGSEV